MELQVLKALLEAWGIDIPKLAQEDGLDERIKAQKLVHLLQNKIYKADLLYGYGMYLHGPYSPELSQDYYQLARENESIEAKPLSDKAKVKVEEIKSDCHEFMKANNIDSDVLALEVLGTTLFFAKGYSESERVVAAVTTAKPRLKENEKHIRKALSFLQDKGYLQSEIP